MPVAPRDCGRTFCVHCTTVARKKHGEGPRDRAEELLLRLRPQVWTDHVGGTPFQADRPRAVEAAEV
eukprot:233148-Alexandrium_andersonii.AAC.1